MLKASLVALAAVIGGAHGHRPAPFPEYAIPASNLPASEVSVKALRLAPSGGTSGLFEWDEHGEAAHGTSLPGNASLAETNADACSSFNCSEGLAPTEVGCLPCPGGRYWRDGVCYPCGEGKYSQTGAADIDECLLCPDGTWSGETATAACQTCGPNTVTGKRGATIADDCYCASGYKRGAGGGCERCTAGEYCRATGPEDDYLGFWTLRAYCAEFNATGDTDSGQNATSGPNATERQEPSLQERLCSTLGPKAQYDYRETCPIRAACLANSSCADGRQGVLCAQCASGHRPPLSKPAALCESCEGLQGLAAIGLLLALAIGLATLAYWSVGEMEETSHSGEQFSRVLCVVRGFIDFMQDVSTLRPMTANFPVAGSTIMSVSLITSLIDSLDCFISPSDGGSPFLTKVQITAFFPLALAAMAAAVASSYVVRHAIKESGTPLVPPFAFPFARKERQWMRRRRLEAGGEGEGGGATGMKRRQRERLRYRVVTCGAFLLLLYSCYAMLTRYFIEVFRCRRLTSTDEDPHGGVVTYAYAGLFIWTVLIPTIHIAILARYRNTMAADDKWRAFVGWVWQGYQEYPPGQFT
ncbi:unnamed protein product [Vitrella brassicaformis CCMP3155]|uniref:Uncharacterized protein n=1 Tax=Vitrella brassicaformis (strain CCMP3155) TaxID=1169540 RepID=A0A0G4FUF1_VITBC|nr:unnamed protein product [Vitrella brassicaformis CCMP3155]|eukprot:CEM18559.1 unnamed protein product [Vitrella brassicaformis CCMP3155]